MKYFEPIELLRWEMEVLHLGEPVSASEKKPGLPAKHTVRSVKGGRAAPRDGRCSADPQHSRGGKR